MNKYLMEFIGTFFLVLIICLAVTHAGPHAAMTVGVGLTTLVYMGFQVSGAHYNPAVTLAVLMRGRITGAASAVYVICQVAGGLAAAGFFWGMEGFTANIGPVEEYAHHHVLKPVAAEAIFTFLLVFTYLAVATSSRTAGNAYYGLAIGFAVMTGTYAAADFSGGAFNPAVGLGIAIVDGIDGGGSARRIGWYLAGPFAGGAAAAVVFRMTWAEDN